MTRTVERIPLPSSSPGTVRTLVAHRFGRPGARPKAYLQAAIHADEPPGMLILHHLMRFLDEADRSGEIRGEVVVVPVANPIGLDQMVQGAVLGRHDFRTSINYNRLWPDLTAGLADRVLGQLCNDADRNAALIRAAVAARIDEIRPASGVEALQLALVRLAHDADLALDLHCDDEAEPYLMTPETPPDRAQALAADTGVRWLMPSDKLDGTYFDASLMLPWVQLRAAAGPERPVPPGCYAAVFEMRGMAAIDDKLAAADAAGLYRHLQRLGAIAGNPGEPDIAQVAVVPVSEELSTPVAGLVVYPAPLGQLVEPGDLVAEILDPSAEPGTPRTALHAGMTGHIISRRLQRIVGPGDFVAMIVGPAANGARG
jgi:predicted deacylase